MTSYGDDLNVANLTVTSVINWESAEFDPPLSGGPVNDPTLAAVLDAGNDANDKSILNCAGIELNHPDDPPGGVYVNDANNIGGVDQLSCAKAVATEVVSLLYTVDSEIECTAGNFTEFKGSVAALSSKKTEFTNCDFSSSTNVHGADNTLAEVLTAGNTANANILMAGNNISGGGAYTAHSLFALNTGGNAAVTITSSSGHQGGLNLNGVAGVAVDTFITGDSTTDSTGAVKKTTCTNLNLTASSNVFPTSLTDETLAEILTNGNSAGSTNIDLNNQFIENCAKADIEEVLPKSVNFGALIGSTLKGSTNAANPTVVTNMDLTSTTNTFPASLDDDTLADVMGRGNSVGANDLNVNTQNITNATNITATGTVATGSLAATGVVQAPSVSASTVLQIGGASGISESVLNMNSTSTSTTRLHFTGTSGQTAFTTFIEGDDVELTLGSGIPTRTKCTNLDLTDASNALPSAPDSANWGAYIYPSTGVAVLSDAEAKKDFHPQCYALTAATTTAAHANQLITVQFHTTKYSFGTIFIGLDISDADGSNKTGLTGKCWFQRFDPKGIQTADRQKVGCCQFTMYVSSATLIDGNQHRIYPTVSTDFTNPGEVEIYFGPGLDPNNPVDNPQLIGSVIIEGKPAPSNFRVYTGAG
tara:strand:+ start:520 stop:2463 length:1944 start_codon:yes stop_codon:yes gene_type:complete